MKTIASKNTVVNSPNLTSSGFTIRQKNLAKIINIVENDIYSDKILAVIREYSCNAYDAHVESGKRDVPIVVSLPSRLNPEFKVRDYGNGLTEQEIHEVYTSYGESTKENSDDYIGQLGIGSKSGFAYGDNFVVTSWKNGIKTVYNAVKGSDVREMVKLYSEPSNDPSGIEISIPVKTGDDIAFKNKSINFFKYWQTQPNLIGVSEQEVKNNDDIIVDGGDWKMFVARDDVWNRNCKAIAIMGNITYPIQWNLVTETLHKTKKLDQRCNNIIRFITYNSVMIRFNIGEVTMAPSREALQYTDHTVGNIINKLERICCELENNIISQISDAKTLWDFKCNINRMFSRQAGGDNTSSVPSSRLNNFDIIYDLVKPKLMFNGVNVNSPNYLGANEWDKKLGKIDPKNPRYVDLSNPIIFEPAIAAYYLNGASNVVIEYAKRTSMYFNITANAQNHFMIMDLDRKTHIKQCIRWYMETNKVNRLYTLSFDNNIHLSDFFKKYDVNGATIVKLSDIFAKFKPLIPKRTKSEKLEDDTVVCGSLNPNNHFSYYRRNTLQQLWEVRAQINLKTQSGYYLDYSQDECVTVNGKKMHVCKFIGDLYDLTKLTGNKIIDVSLIKEVRGFGKQIMNSKKFARNKNNWKNLVTHVEETLSKINKDDYVFSAIFNERAKTADLNKFMINKNALGSIVNDLPDNHMLWGIYNKYPKMIENIREVLDSLADFNVDVDCKKDSTTSALKNEFENNFNIIAAKYPMLKILMLNDAYRTAAWAPRPAVVAEMVNYIKFVDSTSK